MLQAFRVGQQRRIDGGAAERCADEAHRSPYRFQERSAGVLHQMPAIGNMHSLGSRSGRSLTVPAAAVARDDGLAIREQVDDASPLEVADDAAVTLTTLPRPIIDADDAYRQSVLGSMTAHNPQVRYPS